jgi:hypothetical protein
MSVNASVERIIREKSVSELDSEEELLVLNLLFDELLLRLLSLPFCYAKQEKKQSEMISTCPKRPCQLLYNLQCEFIYRCQANQL